MYATSPPATPPPPPARIRSSRGTALVVTACALLFVAVVASIALGSRDISPPEVVRILLHPDGTGHNSHVLWTERIPRTLLGLTVGAALGASGLMMQALTMNPLADPGILGVEQGAAMFVVLGILFLDISGVTGYFWLALAGAGVTSALVYLIGTRTNAGSSTLGRCWPGWRWPP
ncbi:MULTISPECIES: FecCD family ABC transporter permease [Streptomyces]|uniref:FecCD family ABC transporter permease n=1 Tax=Streptomyces bacillaris TaxID=68179 RepID=A0ABW6DWY2_9ACTN|nr:iron chelate uptake ABC transporter family permease subunit [Streptomyces nanshensis]